MKKRLVVPLLALGLLAAPVSFAENNTDAAQEIEDAAKTAGQNVSDEWIEKRVERRISFNNHLSIFDVDVGVNDKQCILTGLDLSKEERALAELVAEETSGVDSVTNKNRTGQG